MLKEALEFQHQLGAKSVQPSLVDLPSNKALLTKADGTSEILVKDRSLRKDSVSSLASLVNWCETYDAPGLDIWVRENGVVAIYDFEQPHETDSVTLKLTHSLAWQSLVNWCNAPRKQKEAVRTLRGALGGTFDDAHLRVFRCLEFKRRNDGGRTSGHAGESLGKSIEALAQSAQGDIPERMVFSLPCFDFSDSPTVQVLVAVEVDPEAETISVIAVGDSFKRATQVALLEIKESIAERVAGAQVYLG